jgi:RHS repeat-associated protein
MSTSSANPGKLDTFVENATAATTVLGTKVQALISAYDSLGPSSEASVSAGSLMSALGSYVTDNTTAERFVAVVRSKFLEADSDTIPDSVIAGALAKAGIGESVPGVPTIASPTLNGMPLNSGWSNDPVCMATGHFVEPEIDLTMPTSIEALGWSRTYNSRFIVDGALGLGWASWADTTLVVDAGSAEYHGPDGQVAVWIADGHGGFLANPGIEADLVVGPDGAHLEWAWRSRRPGARWSFHPDGRIATVHQPGSGTIEAGHDGSRLVSLRHAGGRSLRLRWDGDRIVGVDASDGRSVRYAYDDRCLCRVERPGGAVEYRSDPEGLILEMHDADGVRVIRNEYDADGRVLVQESAHGRITHFDYLGAMTVLVSDEQGGPRTLFRHDGGGRLVELTTGDGTRLVREYDDAGRPVRTLGLAGDETLRRYDRAGNMVWERDPAGGERSREYDDRGRVVATTDPAGTVLTYDYAGDDAVPSTVRGPLGWGLDLEIVDGRLHSVTDADGVTNRIELDADGQAVAFVDGLGRRTAIAHHPCGAVTELTGPDGGTLRFERDAGGRLVRTIGPDGDVATVERSDAGRAERVTDAGGALTVLRWGDDGELEAVTDPLGGVTTLTHDVLGRLTEAVRPDGGRWELAYDALAQLTSFTDPSGAVWHNRWDPAGHWLGLTDPTGIDARRSVDPVGRLIGVDAPQYHGRIGRDVAGRAVAEELGDDGAAVERDALGRATRITWSDGRSLAVDYTAAGRVAARTVGTDVWRYRYDEAGALAAVTLPSGRARTFTYDDAGRRVALATDDGEVVRTEWDTAGRVAAVRTADGGRTRFTYASGDLVAAVAAPDDSVVRVERDALGRIVTVTDALGATTATRWAPSGPPVAVTDPHGSTWSWTLDALGRPVASTDPLGRATTVRRDAAGRVVARVDPDGNETVHRWDPATGSREVAVGGDTVASVRIDADGRRIDTSRRTLVAGEGGTTTPGDTTCTVLSDGRGRPVQRTVDGRTTFWSYDDRAGTVTVTTADGHRIVRHHDAFGRVDWVEHPATGRVSARYDDRGRLTGITGPDLVRTWTYHDGRLDGFTEEAGGVTSVTRLDRDLCGRVVRARCDDVERTYGYDAAGQLVAASGPDGTWEWAYDAAGRMTTETGPDGTRRFRYDAADQLVGVDGPDGTVTFRYDGSGRRVGEDHGARQVRYEWDALDQLVAVHETGPGGPKVTRFALDALGALRAVDAAAVDWSGDDAALLALDGRLLVEVAGSPVALVGDDGHETVHVDWRGSAGVGTFASPDPWGSADATGGPGLGLLGEVVIGPLVWLRARVYDTATRCFLSPDPRNGRVGTPGALTNPYTYAANDPLGHADPLGLQPMSMDQYNTWRAEERKGHWETVATWAADAAIAAACVALVVTSGGAALPLLIGMSGLIGEGGAAFDDVIHGHAPDPTDIAWGGAAGMITAASAGWAGPLVGGAIADSVGMGAGATYVTGVGAGAALSGVGTAGSSAAEQYIRWGNENWGTVAASGAAGLLAGAVPTADVDDPAVTGEPWKGNVWGAPVTAKNAYWQNGTIGGYNGAYAAIGQAATDNSGPTAAPPTAPPNLSRRITIAVGSMPTSCTLSDGGG